MSAAFTRREVNRALLATALGLAAGAIAAPRPEPETLFDFAIAGGYHYGLGKALAGLAPGDALELRREPANPHDAHAVAVHLIGGAKLGFVPRAANEPVADLLDQGRRVSARVVRFLAIKGWTDIPDDLVFTTVASGDPAIRLTLEA